MTDYEPETTDALIAMVGRAMATLGLPVRVLTTDDWLATLVGARVVDGSLLLICHEDDRPATEAELAARDDVIGAA